MSRLAVAVVVATGGLLAAGTATTYATSPAGPRVLHRASDEPAQRTFVRGLGPGCPPFTGTLVERRHLVQDAILRRDGTARVSTVVSARVRLEPADSGVAYRGTYRSLQIGTFADHGHTPRTVTTLTAGTITGSDGSHHRTNEVERLWVDRHGGQHHSDRFWCS